MTRLGQITAALAVAGMAAAFAGPASADEHRGGEGHRDGGARGEAHREGGWRGGGGHWDGRIERFHERDFAVWRGGYWRHDWHGGRYGWWWLAGGLWYFYPSPIYPYPDPYAPPVVQVPVPAPAPAVPAAPPPAQYWYYCDATGGYYPYVSTCPSGWRAVPANPVR